ncbi:MAG TPA: lactate racemase domain-containing protein [Pirellulales bacterium]|nr:lactate racemase domain-containing protein [Pirellulales bacterium]
MILHYGFGSSLELEIPPERLVAECHSPDGRRIADIGRAVARALDEPLEFPSLSKAVVPHDRITLALEPGLPQAAEIVAGIVDYLCRAGADASDITVLRTQDDADAGADDPRSRLNGHGAQQVGLATHQPDDRSQLMYLAATRKGRPIYLNRMLCDADVVLPIGCVRPDPAIAYHGVYGGLYPTFSDTKTLARFRNPHLVEPGNEMIARARHEVDVVGWLSGTQFAVQVLPGGEDTVLALFAGEAGAVSEQGRESSNAAWHYQVPRRAELVICAIPGDAAQQTWDNLGRALAAALRVVSEDGAIVLCTDLARPPGPAVQGLASGEDLSAVLHRIFKQRATDTLAATELAAALERARIYLLSRLDRAFVEDLGIAPVEEDADIARLARRSNSCIVLANAQYAVATPLID